MSYNSYNSAGYSGGGGGGGGGNGDGGYSGRDSYNAGGYAGDSSYNSGGYSGGGGGGYNGGYSGGGGGRGYGGRGRGDDRYGDSSSQRGGRGGGGRGGGGGAYGPGGGGGGHGGDKMGALGDRLNKSIQWDLSLLPKFDKNFYIEHPAVKARGEDEAARWRATNEIHIVGRGIPKPCYTFEEASMPEYVLREVLHQGFHKPSPIQSQGWPMALLGRDMIGISATGSGKTLAFLLPAMIHINAQDFLKPGDGPIVLVLAPYPVQ